MKTTEIVAITVAIAATFILSACGGGGGGGGAVPPPPPPPPPAATLSGQFKDSNVEGLAYTTPSLSGTTDALGTFTYRAGEIVAFSVGAVTLGSASAGPLLTPIDLVAGGSASDAEVINISRFLLLLDEDEDPTNGIRISAAVRQAAVNWTQPDFAAADLGNELVTIISDIASVDARTAALPTSIAAQSHIEGTLYCINSGVFLGTRTQSGAVIGNLLMLMDPRSGIMRASFSGNGRDFTGAQPVTADRQRGFNLTRGGDDNIEGQFDTDDEVSGVWAISGETGEFTATRFVGDPSASLKFVGEVAVTGARISDLNNVMVFGTNSQGSISGGIYVLLTGNETIRLSGTITGQDISMQSTASNASYIGSYNASLKFDGTFTSNSGGGIWQAQGCILN